MSLKFSFQLLIKTLFNSIRFILFLLLTFMMMKSNAIEYVGIEYLKYQELYEEISSKPNANILVEPGIIRIEVPDELTIYFFTEEEHPAHPAIVIRQIIKKGNLISLETKGYTAGNRKVFEQWLRKFEQQTISK